MKVGRLTVVERYGTVWQRRGAPKRSCPFPCCETAAGLL